MRVRAVVFGNVGQLGVELTAELEQRGYEVIGSDRAQLDVTERAVGEQHLAEVDPQVVFNAAAHNQVDVAEEEPVAAYLVNAVAVRNIALACRQVNARLVHYSTDYVFDGRAGRPYTEEDPTHPLGAYAVSKLAGELYAQAYLESPLIIRTSGVFGPGGLNTARGNFIEMMLRLAGEGRPIRVVEDHIASPAYAPALAARSVDLVERHGFQWLKVASCSLGDWPLMERVAQSTLPIILSTAGSSWETLDRVVSFFEHRSRETTLLICPGGAFMSTAI